MQSRAARWIITVTLIGLAGMLHFGLCEYHYRSPVHRNDGLLGLGYYHAGVSDVTGLWPRGSGDQALSVIFGIALPIGMLALCAALVVNWRFVDRQRADRCRKCGYPLHGLASGKCPECGPST